MLKAIVLAATHLAMLAVGFMAGIYVLPILTAPPAPDAAAMQAAVKDALFKASFRRDLKGSDFLHWGEGSVAIARDRITHEGRLAPGPDYRLYLTKELVDTKEGFLRIKAQSQVVGPVKSFNGFILPVPQEVDVGAYTSVVIWCEAFQAFITAAKYR